MYVQVVLHEVVVQQEISKNLYQRLDRRRVAWGLHQLPEVSSQAES